MLSTIQSGIVKVIRSSGKALDTFGKSFEVNSYTEALQPSTQVVKLGKDVPKIDGVFVAPSATVIGKVDIAKGASVWYGAVIRGDDSSVKIASGASIGDRVMIHCSNHPKDLPTTVGTNALVGAGAILHGCTLADACMVGSGAQVMDGATIGTQAVVAPGSFVGAGKEVPAGQVWAGVPARYVRDITAEEAAKIVSMALEDAELAGQHAVENVKTWQQIEDEEYDYEQDKGRNESYFRRLSPEAISKRLGEVENHQVPGRILDSDVSSRGWVPK